MDNSINVFTVFAERSWRLLELPCICLVAQKLLSWLLPRSRDVSRKYFHCLVQYRASSRISTEFCSATKTISKYYPSWIAGPSLVSTVGLYVGLFSRTRGWWWTWYRGWRTRNRSATNCCQPWRDCGRTQGYSSALDVATSTSSTTPPSSTYSPLLYTLPSRREAPADGT